MPRLFTGIELPDDIVRRLSMLRAGLNGASWIDPENYHITMRFVGDITDTQASDFADALADIRFDSFDIEVNGLGNFGGRGFDDRGFDFLFDRELKGPRG